MGKIGFQAFPAALAAFGFGSDSVVPALKTLTNAWEVSRFSKKVAKTFKRGFKFSKRVGGVEILEKK